MIINKEFFFRGWLPAGLVINARLLLTAPDDGYATLKPIINAQASFRWPTAQPNPTFPIDQADSANAILLKDPFPDGALVMLPTGDWYGSGTPYVLAANAWYEGRIQSVSGSDVTATRIVIGEDKSYYWTLGYPDPRVDPDICVANLPCRYIPGKAVNRALLIDEGGSTNSEFGITPTVTLSGVEKPCRLMDIIKLSPIHTFGMDRAFIEDQQPDYICSYLRCDIVAGKLTGTPLTKYDRYGVSPVPKTAVQTFYTVMPNVINGSFEDMNVLLSLPGGAAFAVVASSGDDQLVHYN